MQLGSMTSEGGCSVHIHLWLRKEDREQVVLEKKYAARNLGVSIINPSPPPACYWGMYAHKY